jgi:hypothetical protein
MLRIRTLLFAIILVAFGLLAYRQWRAPTWVDPHITTVNGTTACTHPLGQCPDQPRANR